MFGCDWDRITVKQQQSVVIVQVQKRAKDYYGYTNSYPDYGSTDYPDYGSTDYPDYGSTDYGWYTDYGYYTTKRWISKEEFMVDRENKREEDNKQETINETYEESYGKKRN